MYRNKLNVNMETHKRYAQKFFLKLKRQAAQFCNKNLKIREICEANTQAS